MGRLRRRRQPGSGGQRPPEQLAHLVPTLPQPSHRGADSGRTLPSQGQPVDRQQRGVGRLRQRRRSRPGRFGALHSFRVPGIRLHQRDGSDKRGIVRERARGAGRGDDRLGRLRQGRRPGSAAVRCRCPGAKPHDSVRQPGHAQCQQSADPTRTAESAHGHQQPGAFQLDPGRGSGERQPHV